MAESNSCWSDVTYRLDELERSVGLPQLIQVTEGIDTGSDIDSFSAEDVLMIDQCVTLQKVAAQFAAERNVEITDSGSEYAILKEEILVPLNYKGKLKVICPQRLYNNVRELAIDFPKYATVLSAMRVPQDTGGVMDIAPDSRVELDRIIPGHRNECDKLVISTKAGGHKQVALPFDMRGSFRSCPDDTKYTLKEVIERYSLPKVIKFLDNKIQKIYTQDLLEGIEDMTHVTGSALQINRLVLQKVLIGHYKEPEERPNQSEKFCKRTLVVIPLDSPNIREITVRVRISENPDNDKIYESFLVRNVNADKDYVDMAEGLYVEFVKRPRIIRLKEDGDDSTEDAGNYGNEQLEEGEEEEEDDEPPPPVPPRHGQPGHGEPPPVMPKPGANPKKKPKPKPKPIPTKKLVDEEDYIDFKQDKKVKEEMDEFLDYEVPENAPLPPNAGGQRGSPSPSRNQKGQKSPSLTLASKSPSSTLTPKSPSSLLPPLADSAFDKENVRKVKTKSGKEKHLGKKITGLFRKKSQNETSVVEAHRQQNPDNDEEAVIDDDNLYDEPDDDSYDYAGQTFLNQENIQSKQSKVNAVEKQRPVAHVTPTTTRKTTEHEKPKEFRLLTGEELIERLKLCAMPEAFVEFCKQEQFNGDYLFEADDKMLKTFNLSPLHRQKLKRVITGWLPT